MHPLPWHGAVRVLCVCVSGAGGLRRCSDVGCKVLIFGGGGSFGSDLERGDGMDGKVCRLIAGLGKKKEREWDGCKKC